MLHHCERAVSDHSTDQGQSCRVHQHGDKGQQIVMSHPGLINHTSPEQQLPEGYIAIKTLPRPASLCPAHTNELRVNMQTSFHLATSNTRSINSQNDWTPFGNTTGHLKTVYASHMHTLYLHIQYKLTIYKYAKTHNSTIKQYSNEKTYALLDIFGLDMAKK